jgi:anti-sigma factor RsiW
MMTHQAIQDHLSMLRDQELPEAEQRMLAAHVASCADCRQIAARWQLLGRLFAQVPMPEASELFVEQVMKRIGDQVPATRPAHALADRFNAWCSRWPAWLKLPAVPRIGIGLALLALGLVVVPRQQPVMATEAVLLDELPVDSRWPFLPEPPDAGVLEPEEAETS